MDLAHLTGHRPADLLKLYRSDIHEEMFWFAQNKTGTKLRREIIGELKTLIDRILSRKHKQWAVMQNGNGQRLSWRRFPVSGYSSEYQLQIQVTWLLRKSCQDTKHEQ